MEYTETATEIYMQGLYHAELYKWAAAPCIQFFAQQAARVGFSGQGQHPGGIVLAELTLEYIVAFCAIKEPVAIIQA